MNRDILVTQLENNKCLVTSVDCSGGVGSLDMDIVKASPETVAYYTARVAFMEVMSAKARPIAYTISNFTNYGYDEIHNGINQLLDELGIKNIEHITSSETNFSMVQSALGITVIGIAEKQIESDIDGLSFACIGSPLVGNEVMEYADKVIPAKIFASLAHDNNAKQLVPTGSKGVACKLKSVFDVDAVSSDIDLSKSTGPSTCVILGYESADTDYFKSMLKDLFHPIKT